MIKSAVTISLVEQARSGPFVFHDDLREGCRAAAELGFDAVEIFAPSAEALRALPLKQLLKEFQLELTAVGTGAGMLVHGLHLCDPDADRRRQAESFIASLIDAGAVFGAPAIIGSMQGRRSPEQPLETVRTWLRESLDRLGQHAADRDVRLIYEPLNRYETNLINTIGEGIELLDGLSTDAVVLLADLFHMNIEETSIADALRVGGSRIGHVHFVDSNRQAAGRGHTAFAPIADALIETGYDGCLSAEAFPIPDSQEAARQTAATFQALFR